MVNSPLGSMKYATIPLIGLITNSSCALVSSRATATSLSGPQRSSMASKVWRTRCGASKNTLTRGSRPMASSQIFRSFDRIGGKPRNTNSRVWNPHEATAAMTALGPGMLSTRIPAARAAATRVRPGSEMSGVPASETSAIDSPASSRSMSFGVFSRSLCSWRLVVRVEME